MWKRLNLATKQFIFLFIGSSVLFGSLAYNQYIDSVRFYKEQALSDMKQIIDRTNLFLDAYVAGIQNLLLFMSEREELFEPGNEEEATDALWRYGRSNSGLIRMIYFMREDGRVFASDQVVYTVVGNPALQRVSRLGDESFGMNWSEPYETAISGRTLAFVRSVYREDDNRKLGTIIVEIDLERLSTQLAPLLSGRERTFAVLTAGNRFVAFDESNAFMKQYDRPQGGDAFAEDVGGVYEGVAEQLSGAPSYVGVISSRNRLGWSIIALIHESYYTQRVAGMLDNFRTTAIVWLLIIFVSTFFMTRYLTRPIRTLVAKMDRVQDVEVLPLLSVTREDEVGRLAQSYNAMMERIKGLIAQVRTSEQQKKNLEIEAMQNQISPHFLYNTLSCISSLAGQQKMNEVRDTIRNLIKLLSYSFRGASVQPLYKELEAISIYIQIQQVRYGGRIRYYWDVDDEAMAVGLPKLTLQPLVENCIFHGLAGKPAGGTIRIRGRAARGTLSIYVTDNGVGVAAGGHSEPDGLGRHIGMSNVHQRIRTQFGEHYGIRLRSIPGVATTVRITLPMQQAAADE